MTRIRCTSMALCLVLLLSLSAGHTSGATTAPATPPKTTSLDVQGTDVRDVLRLLAETGGVNIVASGEVQGTITVRLVDVPWEQALDAVLKLTGLAVHLPIIWHDCHVMLPIRYCHVMLPIALEGVLSVARILLIPTASFNSLSCHSCARGRCHLSILAHPDVLRSSWDLCPLPPRKMAAPSGATSEARVPDACSGES